jgi:hypothetical protein
MEEKEERQKERMRTREKEGGCRVGSLCSSLGNISIKSKWETGRAYGRKRIVKHCDGVVASIATVAAIAATIVKAVQK